MNQKTSIIGALVVVAIVLIGALGYVAFVHRPSPIPTGSVHNGTMGSIRAIPSGVEIELTSDKEFPVRNELAVLRIGAQEFTSSRYPESGDTQTLIFTLTQAEFDKTATGDPVTVYYGRGGESGERWSFGQLDKSLHTSTESPTSSATEPTPTPTSSLPPQGLYDSCEPSTGECRSHLDKMAEAGFKVVINYGIFDYDVADITSYADYASAVGMKVIWDMSSRPYRDGTFSREYVRERVESVKTHPATWGYYVADEPGNATPNDIGAEQGPVKALSDYVRQLDPAHPRFVVHWYEQADPVGTLRPYVDSADVIALDVYPLGSCIPSEDVGAAATASQGLADEKGKQWAIVLQSFDRRQYPDEFREIPCPGWPDRERMLNERNLALKNSHPAFILWYSYFDILRSSDPAGHWADLVAAAFGPGSPVEPTSTSILSVSNDCA